MADMSVAPLKIVGVEGLFGSLMMLVVLLPLVSFLPGQDGSGIHEDTWDTLHVRQNVCVDHCCSYSCSAPSTEPMRVEFEMKSFTREYCLYCPVSKDKANP